MLKLAGEVLQEGMEALDQAQAFGKEANRRVVILFALSDSMTIRALPGGDALHSKGAPSKITTPCPAASVRPQVALSSN